MDARDYVRFFGRFWRSILATTLAGLLAASALVLSATPQYQASVRLFVSTQTSSPDTSQLSQGGLFTQQRVKSYADIVGSDSVMNAVIRDLRLSTTPRELSSKVSASAPLDTVLINISVRDKRPEVAQAIANAVGTRFASFVNQLETPANAQASPVKVSVVQPAALPVKPVSPKKAFDLGLGLIFGLLVGLGQAVLRVSLDTRIKSARDLGAEVDAPIVGLIPFDRDASEQPVITDASPHSVRAEAFRQLRTNLQFVDVDNAPKSIVVTSSVPQEGKSTSTANLAVTMVRAGLRVVVVEADLRRPRLMKYLGIQGSHVGLTDVLIGRTSIDAALVHDGPGGVTFLPSGTTPPNPSELLSSAAMQRTITDLASRFDLVLLDAPPLLPVTDAAVLSTLTDGVLLVVRAGSTRREQVARSVEILAGVDARILGVVLNMVDRKSRDAYGYYYYYSTNDGSKKPRRGAKPDEIGFTPDRIVPAKPERRTKGDQDPLEGNPGRVAGLRPIGVNGAPVIGPIPAAASSAYAEKEGTNQEDRADSVRAAVYQAFSRGLNQPQPSIEHLDLPEPALGPPEPEVKSSDRPSE